MNDQTLPSKIVDGFDIDANDETASPIRGNDMRFKDGDYVVFGEEIDVTGKSYAVIDRRQGWQKLETGCPPEYLMRKLGEPRPLRPHIAEEDWPLDLNGKPAHPYRWTTYLYLLEIGSGQISTFWTNTIGGNRAVGELADQVAFMRQHRPNAIPVVALKARDMPTQYGATKPRPHFEIFGYSERGLESPRQIENAATKLEQFAAETPATKTATTKSGVTRFDKPELKPIEKPSSREVFDDEIGF